MPHVFVAGSELDVTDASGQECSLAQGDVVQLNTPPPPDSPAATLIVMASKPRECLRGTSVTVQLTDLQEMQNHMRQTIDSGLGNLQTNAGKGGLPAVPVAAKAAPTPAPFAMLAPPPDPTAATVIAQQAQEARQKWNRRRQVPHKPRIQARQRLPLSQPRLRLPRSQPPFPKA